MVQTTFATLQIGQAFTYADMMCQMNKSDDCEAVSAYGTKHAIEVDTPVLASPFIPPEPVMPLQGDFLDDMGYPDYEAYDYAFGQYECSHSHWYEHYGRKLDEVNGAWAAREQQLAAGRWA